MLLRAAALQIWVPDNAMTIPAHADWAGAAPAPFQPGLARLALGMAQAHAGLDAAFAPLTAAQRADLVEHGAAALVAEHALALGHATPAQRDLAARIRDEAGLVRMPALLQAAVSLARAGEDAQGALPHGWVGVAAGGTCGVQGSLVFASPDCSVLVGDAGPTTYTLPAALIVDEGGADRYLNNAGGGNGRSIDGAPPVAMLLDLGAGNDVYASNVSGTGATQGAGYLGAGLLLDEGGDDTYTASARDLSVDGRFAAQGTALDGAGILWDQGSGSDAYASRNAAQGTGLIGFGLLLDEGGADRYSIPYTFDSEATQGTGCYGGDGLLLDRGTGNDVYDGSIDDLQGMGCLGGLGLLYDAGGDDTYLDRSGWGELDGLTVLQSGWGQGYGELGRVGLLLDAACDDVYTAAVQDPALPRIWEAHHA
ncbi:MAG: hypothetical protein LC624_04515, partial [Halobacteriales archaeon]|nr:hypothetical protein [Halobacteriales archaeon]